MSLLPPAQDSPPKKKKEGNLPPPTDKNIRPVSERKGRFDQSLKDFLGDAQLDAYAEAFTNCMFFISRNIYIF
jgi:hypothetical protein